MLVSTVPPNKDVKYRVEIQPQITAFSGKQVTHSLIGMLHVLPLLGETNSPFNARVIGFSGPMEIQDELSPFPDLPDLPWSYKSFHK